MHVCGKILCCAGRATANMNRRILSRPCVVSASRCICFCGAQTKHVLLLVCWAGTAGRFVFSSLCPRFLQVAGSASRLSPFVSLSSFSTAVGHSRVLEHAIAMSVVSVANADCPFVGGRKRKPSPACLVVQRPVHSRSVRLRHPEESTLTLVLSPRVERQLWRESHATHAPFVSYFSLSRQVER